jgi:hypothetical protein
MSANKNNSVFTKGRMAEIFTEIRNSPDPVAALDAAMEQYKPQPKGKPSVVNFEHLQSVIDKNPVEGRSYSNYTLCVASQYNVKYGKKNPIKDTSFVRWVEKGHITMPIAPPAKKVKANSTVVTETMPDGGETVS